MIWYHTMPCHAIPCHNRTEENRTEHIISYDIVSYRITLHHFIYYISFIIIWFHSISYHTIPYRVMSCHVMSCHVMSSYHISYHISCIIISISYHISYHIFNTIGLNLIPKVTTSMSTGLTSRLLWVLAMPNNNVIQHWYSSNVKISKLRWILIRHCPQRVPQKLLVICCSINQYWQCIPISSEVQHPDLNHHMEYFMGVQPTKLGIIPHPTSKGIT